MFNIVRNHIYHHNSGLTKIIVRNIKVYPVVNYEKEQLTLEEWNKKCQKLINISSKITIYEIIKGCFSRKNIKLADSFLAYVEQTNISLLPITKAYYLQMLTIHEEHQQLFIEMYVDLEKNHFSNSIVKVAAENSRVFAERKFNVPNRQKSFHNVLETDGLLAALQLFPPNKCYVAVSCNLEYYLEIIEDDKDSLRSKMTLKHILKLLCTERHSLKESIYIRILQYLQNKKINYSITTLLNDTPCPNCGTSLPQPTITQEDVNNLRDALENDIVTGKNIYFNTTPEIWQKFKIFLAENGRFDFVVDGLNFIHKFETNCLVKLKDLGQLDKLKILFIGRSHSHDKIFQCGLSTNASFSWFYPDIDCKDDLYTLYAALYSGLGTKLISGDFFRDHKKFNDQELIPKLIDWQKLHQLLPLENSLHPCSLYDQRLHYSEDIFHINPDKRMVLVPESKWLCFKL